MGILNVTPDSFSDGGEHASVEQALAHARKMLAEGADIIDVGGESTRPGADEVSDAEELARVLPVVRELASAGVAVSVDTRHALVAAECVDAGACIINDISGFRDRKMREVAARSDVGLVVMHMRGEPKNMQNDPRYADVVYEVEIELGRMVRRMEAEGIERERICLDVGVGFGKRADHNQELVQATGHFAELGYPTMGAVSRKSFIGVMSGIEIPAMRDRASALCAAYMINQGANVVRVHNVQETREMIQNSRRAIIGLGSNMGNAGAHLDAAIDALRFCEDVWVGAISQYVTSEPAYFEAQAPFTNAIAVIQTTLSPHELLEKLHEIENEQGRVRTVANGPRTLDLDIVDYEGVVSNDPELTLPHPLALERDFVVTPLLELMPACVLADGTQVTRAGVRVGRVQGDATQLSS